MFETTSTPGHLAPTAERLERLLVTGQTLEELYDVEEQPFARGKYATVRRCRERSSGKQWAAKYLRKRRRAQELRAEALHEVAVLDAAAHCPHLVSLHQVFETNTEMVLVLELAPGGELQMVLDRDEIPEERQVAKLLKQILDGVAFLHSLNVAHLDIKPQNLVLTGEFPDCDVKLCDFGISRYISQGADIREILGTPDYIAPEVLNYEPISLATDMWSVGVLLYVLLTGCSPFGGDTKQETFCNISRCKLDFPDDLFEEVSQEAQDLIKRLIVKNPSERLSAVECLQHSWLSQFEDSNISSVGSVSLFVSEANEITPEEETPPASPCDNNNSSSSSLESSRCCSSSPEAYSPDSVEETTTASTCIENQNTLEELEQEQQPQQTVIQTPEEQCWRTTPEDDEDDDDDDVRILSPEASTVELDATDHRHSSSPSPINGLEDFSFHHRTDRERGTRINSRNMLKHQSVFTGLSSERRSNFKRSMDYLARKFSASADLLEVFDDLEIETSSRRSSVNAMSASVSEVFKCSPVFILGEEQQCSDSGSDTVSEISSTDSSSDRSSIYSDDSLDFILYGKSSQGRVSFPFSATESQSWKQRNHLAATGLRHGPRVWPRECSGVVSKALSRFTTVDLSSSSSSSSSSVDVSGSKSQTNVTAGSSASSTSSISIASSSITRTSTSRNSITGLEGLRGVSSGVRSASGENLVVIREPVRAGRYMRYSEVKCESVQARIRRLHVQNHASSSSSSS